MRGIAVFDETVLKFTEQWSLRSGAPEGLSISAILGVGDNDPDVGDNDSTDRSSIKVGVLPGVLRIPWIGPRRAR